MVSPAERARLDFIKRTRKRERKFAGMSVADAIAKHNKDVNNALAAAQKEGVQISLTDLFVSAEQIAEKKARERQKQKVPKGFTRLTGQKLKFAKELGLVK